MAITGKVGAVFSQDGNPSTTFTDEATTADATKTRYTINNVAKRYWDDTAAVTVKKNGVVQTSGFTIEYAGGVVVFDTPLTTETILVSGKYFGVVQVGGFFNWSLDLKADTIETTDFSSGGWKTYAAGLKGWTAKAGAYWANTNFFNDLGTEQIIVLYMDAGAGALRFEGSAIVSGDGIDCQLDAVVKESVEFQGVGGLYYRAG